MTLDRLDSNGTSVELWNVLDQRENTKWIPTPEPGLYKYCLRTAHSSVFVGFALRAMGAELYEQGKNMAKSNTDKGTESGDENVAAQHYQVCTYLIKI